MKPLLFPLALLVGLLACSAPRPHLEPAAPWIEVFDGDRLGAWEDIPFGGQGEVITNGEMGLIPVGSPLSGLRLPEGLEKTTDYEIEVDALRRSGSDFFCGLTLPVGESHGTVILGGWGGALCGFSCLDGLDASENETKSFQRIESGRLYRLRVRVEAGRLQAWLDEQQLFDVALEGRIISPRTEMLPSLPLAVSSYITISELHRVRWRPL